MNDYSELQSIHFFVAIAEAGSFSAAAKLLDFSTAALSQRLKQLESRLGVRLLDRDARGIKLTEEGEQLLVRGQALLREFDSMMEETRGSSGRIAGSLRIHGPLGFGRSYLAKMVADFHALHPALDISLTLSDRFSANRGERVDIVVHIGELPDSDWVAYPIAPNRRFLCAAPQFLASQPPFEHPDQLRTAPCLVLKENDEDAGLWSFERAGENVSVRVSQAMSVNDGDVIKQWALAGKGIILRSEWDVADDLRAGRLLRLMPGWEARDADVVALVPHRTGMPLRQRSFLTFMQERFRPIPPWRAAADVDPDQGDLAAVLV
ncbi:LysR family transcriptional regulator [Chitinimonas sp.]|uniref:LysR family transcriptional regulator n=1 Tax=Chitinimonas sp. TaxID=1934313 RepID=UPI0035B3ADE1